ncbi:MAG TPA: HEAT repeat domain-containing protein [Longimicrobiales bacterium]|nr:HEAT repeat domain-containing protein [Longimicrobiales bacterium]
MTTRAPRLPRVALVPVLTLALAAAGCTPPDPGRPDFEARAYLRIVAAEDARPTDGRDLETLLAGLAAPSPRLRAVSVRGLGRLENPALLEPIAPLMGDPDRGVRREAANALAQAVHRGPGDAALPVLLAAVERESDPLVLGALARSLGRLRLDAGGRATVAGALVSLSLGPEGDAPPYQMEGAALGMASWVRGLGDAPRPPLLQDRLAEMTRYGLGAPAGDVGAARVRALAVGAWVSAETGAGDMRAFLADAAPSVRHAAASRLGMIPPALRAELAATALSDPSPQVRLEAVRRGLGAGPTTTEACRLLATAAEGDADVGVRLTALDALALPCPDRGPQEALLRRLADAGAAAAATDWHVGAHALAALAALDARSARAHLSAWAAHPSFFARSWAAVAATRADDADILRALTGDAHPNVRTEALRGLAAVLGRDADAELLAALGESGDNQLLLTAAALLEGTAERASAAEAALGALERISRPRWETLRDARIALLGLLQVTGDSTLVPRVDPWLRDYDPVVAERAAEALASWTGAAWTPAPERLPGLPLPTPAELRAMEEGTVLLRMARGGAIEIRLLPWQAPTNAVRFFRMVGSGALDGLTLHRWVPNFVIQGGSPGANEYAGHGAFTRDEVGLAQNWRGTVGLSTRGRDTGDGQIYVNLVDNVRLDHDYTVFGVVTAGMEVADRVLEGDVIERAEVRPGPQRR